MKFTGALLSTYGGMVESKDIRNNQRVIWQLKENDEILKSIWNRIEKEMPDCQKLRDDVWKPIGLNERLR